MRLLLVDSHVLFREGLALLLGSLESRVEVLQASSGEFAIELVDRSPEIDIVLVDLDESAARAGIDTIRLLHERHPPIPVVAVSGIEDEDVVFQAIDAGAMGYVPKTSTSPVLRAALRLVLSGGVYLPPSIFLADHGTKIRGVRGVEQAHQEREEVTPGKLGLTARQADVLAHILQGKSAKSIGAELRLSASTVKVHTSAVLRALRVSTRTQAIVAASKLGLRFPMPKH
jgi:DNA-binding NarL/FixJ family response regulator